MAVAATTELESINIMLAAIGEAPINSLTGTLPVDARIAQSTLSEVNKSVQSEGWSFNTEIDVKLSRDNTNHVHLSTNILRVDANIHQHLNYIAYLVDRRNWLAGNEMTLADLTAAAHLSCIDYVGDVPWEQHMSAKNWYARVKSRPSFRSILQDQVPGTLPAKHYNNLDF